MHECSGEMRYWENHYDKVQAVFKLKEAETTFQNIALWGYLAWNSLLIFSLSGHSITRSNSRWAKVSQNQDFFSLDENLGSQSQRPAGLEDSAEHCLSSLLTGSLLCSSITHVGQGHHLSDNGQRQKVPGYYPSWTKPRAPSGFLLHNCLENTPGAMWTPSFRQESKSLKGTDL